MRNDPFDRLRHGSRPGRAFLALAGGAALFAFASLAQAAPANDGARPGNVIGTGNSLPRSSKASNIGPSDTKSAIAPSLPVPQDASGPAGLLEAAQKALTHKQSGLAQESLERAQTRLLDRSVLATETHPVDTSPAVQAISAALNALGQKNYAGAQAQVKTALDFLRAAGQQP